MTAHQMLLGAGGKRVELTDADYSFSQDWPTTCIAGCQYRNDGQEYFEEGVSWNPDDTGRDWLISGNASDFYIRCDITGSALATGSSATGSWLNLGTTRGWYVQSPSGYKFTTCTIQISDSASGSPVLDSCTITLEAESIQ